MDLEIQLQVSDLKIDTDSVLRAEGADPALLRTRSAHLAEVADQALRDVQHWLEPKFLCRQLEVRNVRHDRLELEDGFRLCGFQITKHLAACQTIVAVLCTIGMRVEEYASQRMSTDLVLGLAVDAVGSAGVEALANSLCAAIEHQAVGQNMQATVPFSPGMVGWPVEEGQPFIFGLLDASKIGVALSSHCVMLPRKSLSMLIGIGMEVGAQGKTCDFCGMNKECRYQDYDRYAKR